MNDFQQQLRSWINDSAQVIGSLAAQADRIEAIALAMVGALKGGSKVLTMGHGGSAAEAMHLSEELMGRYKAERRPLPAVALVADPTLLTCIGNDYGFTHLFPRQVMGLGSPGDVLVIFSSSGNGEGLRMALEAARMREMTSVALLGKGGGAIAGKADLELIVGSGETARVQEAHTLILHLILEAVDAAFVE